MILERSEVKISGHFNDSKKLRWWPALIIIILTFICFLWIWTSEEDQDQIRTMKTGGLLVISCLLILLWWITASRLNWKIKSSGLLLLLICGIITKFLFYIEGVDGNLVPIIRWKWTQRPVDSISISNHDSYKSYFQISESDYPQFLGPNRDARINYPILETNWAKNPPTELWKQPIGAGWSSYAVVDNLAITQEQRGSNELIVAYNIHTGNVIWAHSDKSRFENALGGIGPRATPTISEQGKVFSLGAKGILNCLDFRTGRMIWQRDIQTDNDTDGLQWGRSSSPLIVNDLVVVNPGGINNRALVAYDQSSGKIRWASGDYNASYVSPALMDFLGRKQIVIINQKHVTAHDPLDGTLLWQEEFPSQGPHCSQPVAIDNNSIFVSSGYGVGSRLFSLSVTNDGKFSSKTVWKSKGLKAKFTTVVLYKGFLYGLDDGILVCLDPTTGKRKWKKGRYGHGQLILVKDILLIISEQGRIVLVEPNPTFFREIAGFEALSGKTWNTPALSRNILLVRNHKEAAAYRLPIQGNDSSLF